MARLTPRMRTEIKASIIDTKGTKHAVALKNIGLGGVGLGSAEAIFPSQSTPGSTISMGISLKTAGELITTGEVVWNTHERLGIRFVGISRGDLLKIWVYIRDFLVKQKCCPYCGQSFDSWPGKCKRCGWDLNFLSKDYLSYWERELLLRKLRVRLSAINIYDLRKISRFVEDDALSKKSVPEIQEIEEFVGTCQAMKEVYSLIRKVAPTDLPVLILGESGTGKELTACALHERSLRKDKPFIAINCAAIPESLIEAELFGHEKAAFTGAYAARKGKFEYAHKGTLFLDEIGELPPSLQPKLLRFLETQMVEPIGSKNSVQVDVRIITATNSDLKQAVAEGRFRSDLYHRIKVFTIQLSPLRERGEDKIILAHYFLKKIKMERAWKCKGFTPEALDVIREHAWPGNVREMINRVRRAVVVQDEWIRSKDLELESPQETNKPSKLKAADKKLRKELVESALREHQYNISQTARSLGVSRPYVYLLIKKLGIHIPRRATT